MKVKKSPWGWGLSFFAVLGDPGVDGRIIFRWIFRKWDVGVWTGLRWFRIEIRGRHLCMW
jgi:hypothetical protein